MKQYNRISTAALLVTALLLFPLNINAQSKDFKTAKNLEIQHHILGELSTRYVDTLDFEQLITTGITAGASMYLLAVVTAVIMILLVIIFYNKQQKGRIYIAVIHYVGDEAGDNVIRAFGKMKYFIKSKTVRKDKTEMAVEVYCKDNDMFFLDRIRDTEGVEDATLIQYNGEYHG